MNRSPTETLRLEIERFLRRTGMAPTTFGQGAVGDPNLVDDLRRGRELRFRTVLKIQAFLNQQRQSA